MAIGLGRLRLGGVEARPLVGDHQLDLAVGRLAAMVTAATAGAGVLDHVEQQLARRLEQQDAAGRRSPARSAGRFGLRRAD